MISCSQYDYVEIACLYKYPLKLTLTSGDVVVGKALDTRRNADGQECMLLLVEDEKILVLLDDIKQLAVTISNPHFEKINF